MVAIIVCDVWDTHWHVPTRDALAAGFASRVDAFLRRMRPAVIIHAPSTVIADPSDLPFGIDLPPPERLFESPPPHDPPWTRQHPDIEIADTDFVTDSGAQIFRLLASRGITKVLLVGMHTELCILHNDYGAINLRDSGFSPLIVRDLTLPYGEREKVENKITELGFEFIEAEQCFGL